MSDWLAQHYVEVLGVVLSIIYLVLSIRQNILLWPVGILSAVMYVIVFYQSKFYADMGLNAYYFVISIYGWINWSGAARKEQGEPPVISAGLKQGLLLLLVMVAIFFMIGCLLKQYTDSPIPYWDALTTAGSIVATWMLTRKILEHWIVWIVVDLMSMGLYIYRGLYPTAFLFLVYTIMAVVGYLEWRRSKNQ
ncbi:MAG: nicotinamide riboside transporter PnuC [Bacteroidales bacterium]|nr:nicotinamide riboside transporter PnuC [Bacteroidales bacterium]MDT8430065.1 nicotinamide riboside transporter PnuC [Bacteroidales bacterium]